MEYKTKILIIDDSNDLREAMKDILTFKGYETTESINGREGLEKALSEKPDLILVDVRMPDMGGFDFVRALRKDTWGAGAKVLILTASASVDDIPSDLNVSPEDFLQKTQWGIDSIVSKIEEKIGA